MLAFIVAWLACGLVGSGFAFAYAQGEFQLAEENYKDDLGKALRMAFYGPVGLIVCFLHSEFGKHGWRLR